MSTYKVFEELNIEYDSKMDDCLLQQAELEGS